MWISGDSQVVIRYSECCQGCVLVKPITDHFARPDTTQLDAFTAPSLLAADEGEAGPANLALSGQADGPYTR